MTIEQAKENQTKLEKFVSDAVHIFELETGLTVKNLYITECKSGQQGHIEANTVLRLNGKAEAVNV